MFRSMKPDKILKIDEFLPKEGHAKGIQIDLDGRMLGIRYPMDVNLQGDSRDTLRELIPLLKRKEDRSWQEKIIKEMDRWWRVLEARAHNTADPLNPQYVYWELSKRLPDNCILSADSGSTAAWFAINALVDPLFYPYAAATFLGSLYYGAKSLNLDLKPVSFEQIKIVPEELPY